MKTIKILFALIIAMAMTACVEDKVYEGPTTIDGIAISPEAPTSFDDIVVTANFSGLQEVTSAVLKYTIGDKTTDVDMVGNGKTYTATIPAQPDGTKVTYVVVVTNEAGFTAVSPERDFTVGDKPSDYSKLVLNELFGSADTDEGKYIELYNNGDDPIKLKGVVIRKDEADAWTGEEGEVIMGHSYFKIVGAKGTVDLEKSDSSRGLSSGFSAKKSVLIELVNPSGVTVDKFQRGEKGASWGDQSLSNNKETWSRCPNGTGKFMIAPGTLGEKNPDTGTVDETVVQ
ncbi:MAG: lamin tail domain-containing protein [Muribaculaceae bacterium]|nr:lamin tail domain-containing protein [Muribaculaceae bacterium]